MRDVQGRTNRKVDDCALGEGVPAILATPRPILDGSIDGLSGVGLPRIVGLVVVNHVAKELVPGASVGLLKLALAKF